MLLSRMARRRAKVWALSTVSATALASVSVTNAHAQDALNAARSTKSSSPVHELQRDGY